ncbi:serine/threonine protein phosphatase [Thecamonas trahens ATCC 50062]|uniref:Serine/threonine-protein phosphatase n=1 Tax=Thecamonas trahens ATCC 50062 TaxID=461836 RepID=A0A0L0DK99_THETB|nr:serine/threonine protein phosphatase [Thecamonas trahens ATCC 50062]KNC52834.1 serine/threonine protein phosphatase [Thecamonas trahens ATCC 50062]|eukprot:XP_013754939.1 serine/threonine protein phosphatase [Thecamonas trahens ATCC 50062]
MPIGGAHGSLHTAWDSGSDSDEDDTDKVVWEVWNLLDSYHEQSAIKTHVTMKPLEGLIRSRSRSRTKGQDKTTIGAGYKGPHLPEVLTLESVIAMLDHFRTGRQLHYVYAKRLLKEATHILRDRATIVDIPVKKTVTVVGDIHGQLRDLLKILSLNGYPSEDNVYLFNGDFVDRGDQGTEVFLSLCAFLILMPNAVFLNRGNHETLEMNQTYGFMKEVKRKYDKAMFQLFQTTFCALPLGSVVGNKIFVVHGGLFHHVDLPLSVLRKIRREVQPELGRLSSVEDQIMEDLMWSDPKDSTGITPNRQRGAGALFGPDVTEQFLEANDLSLLIRSHEMKERGYEVAHGGLLATIFSASNYNGAQNHGAYGVISSSLEVKMKKYSTLTAEEVPPPEERTAILIKAVQDRLTELVCQHRVELVWYYDALDVGRTGKVSLPQWAQGMQFVLQLELPWKKIYGFLLDADCVDDETNEVWYVKFLEKNKIDVGNVDWGQDIINKVNRKIYETCRTAEAAFQYFDADGDGVISCSECASTLLALDIGLNDRQIYEFMRSVDSDMDNSVSLAEFRSRFEVVFASDGSVSDDWAQTLVNEIGKRLFEHEADLSEIFHKFDADESGTVDIEEFGRIVKYLGYTLTPEEHDRLMAFVDTDGSGHLDYEEWLAAFAVVDAADSTHWQENVMQQINSVLYRNKDHLQRMFNIFDVEDQGVLPPEDVRVGLATLNELLSSPLTEMQIDVLLNALEKDDSGHIIYQPFLDNLRIVNTDKKATKYFDQSGSSTKRHHKHKKKKKKKEKERHA